jgi:hypothetical protein
MLQKCIWGMKMLAEDMLPEFRQNMGVWKPKLVRGDYKFPTKEVKNIISRPAALF